MGMNLLALYKNFRSCTKLKDWCINLLWVNQKVAAIVRGKSSKWSKRLLWGFLVCMSLWEGNFWCSLGEFGSEMSFVWCLELCSCCRDVVVTVWNRRSHCMWYDNDLGWFRCGIFGGWKPTQLYIQPTTHYLFPSVSMRIEGGMEDRNIRHKPVNKVDHLSFLRICFCFISYLI